MINRRGQQRRNRVTDEQVEAWVQQESFAKEHAMEMAFTRFDLDLHLQDEIVPPLGSIPLERGDGIFRGMSVQLNSMAKTKAKFPFTEELRRNYGRFLSNSDY